MSIRLEEIKEAIRREIRKELKIKEGAEKLREVAKDRRSLSDVAVLVKKSKSKLAELKSELQELESQILLTSANTAVNSNGQGESAKKIHLLVTYVSAGYLAQSPCNRLRHLQRERALNLSWKSLFTSTCHANPDDDLSIYQRLVVVVSARYICIYGARSDITWREILVRLSSPLVAYL